MEEKIKFNGCLLESKLRLSQMKRFLPLKYDILYICIIQTCCRPYKVHVARPATIQRSQASNYVTMICFCVVKIGHKVLSFNQQVFLCFVYDDALQTFYRPIRICIYAENVNTDTCATIFFLFSLSSSFKSIARVLFNFEISNSLPFRVIKKFEIRKKYQNCWIDSYYT